MSRTPGPERLEVPDFSLIVLIGAAGSGKSTFARRHFEATEIISPDGACGLLPDGGDDPSANAAAFDLASRIAERRLKDRRLTVIDATNVRAAERKHWVQMARRWHAPPVAIVLDPGLDVCVERNKLRPERNFDPRLARRMVAEIRQGLHRLQLEGFRQIRILSSATAIDTAAIERRPLGTDRRNDAGPFDIIGDVHGCADELETLLARLGHQLTWQQGNGERTARIEAPHGRKIVLVGDLVDRGPRTPDVLRIALAAVEAGGYVVEGNHDNKLARWMEGRDVKIGGGLRQSIDQLSCENDAFKAKAKAFLDELRSHYWLDGGRLAVVHAGLTEDMIARCSSAVRAFELYGETTGKIDEYGMPIRADWAANYRGPCAIVHGHTPVVDAEWRNNTICLDTGCVFGGRLTALRWPERETVSVPATRTYWATARPLAVRTATTGGRRIESADLLACRDRRRAEQDAMLDEFVAENQRLGLHDKE